MGQTSHFSQNGPYQCLFSGTLGLVKLSGHPISVVHREGGGGGYTSIYEHPNYPQLNVRKRIGIILVSQS